MSSIGLSFDKILIILVIALFLIGPERLPRYAAQLGRLARAVRDMANGAKDRMREEMGPDFDDVEWSKLDPRQYDPRRIIREALLDSPDDDDVVAAPASGSADDASDPAPSSAGGAGASADAGTEPRYVQSAYDKRVKAEAAAAPAPYDAEST